MALAFAALFLATPAHADHALLVGVGAYPDLPASLQLEAPEEDARRVASALRAAGFPGDAITLMTATDGVQPTRSAVLAALDRLAAQASRGEQILVYFSGHGAQAPTATPALEPDGFDELYLMRDARGWDGGQGRVPGAILDKELAAKLAAIRAGGADVWLVVDSCHAGGAFRGTGDGARTKSVSGRALTIPDRIEATSAALFVDPPGAGRLAAFFAAAPGALAVERRLPLGSPDARPLSQFSYALTRAIASGRLRSLRDLATAIGASDAALGGDAPEPVFEGMLEMPVLGLPADRPRRYPLARDTMTLPAGVEEGLAAGDSVRLLAAGTVVGEAKVVEAGLGVSRLAAAPLLPTGSIEAERMLGAGGGGQAALLAAIAPLVARGAAADLEVSAQLWRPGAAPQCPTLPGGSPRGATSVPMLSPPPLGQCDVLIATIANRGIAAVDISPIYFDAGGRVSGLGFVGGGSARVRPGEARRVAIRALATGRDGAPSPLGVERMAIVALPAVTRTPRDLRGAASATFRSGTTAALDAGAGALVYRWRVVGR